MPQKPAGDGPVDLPLAAMSATTMIAQVVIAAGGLVVEPVSASAPFVHRLRVI